MRQISIVEDEQSIREMMCLNLELEGYRVLSFSDGQQALQAIETLKASDLVILDVMLPHVNGLALCETLRKTSSVPILFLSAKGTTSDKIEGLKKGGNDYLAKPFDLEELLLRVKVLTDPPKSTEKEIPETYQLGNKTIDKRSFIVSDHLGLTVYTLSKKEMDLLLYFIMNEGKVVSRDEILDNVWGKDVFPTSRTIDNFILQFRRLFEEDTKSPKYFHSIRSVGYRFTRK
jgi:two-component system alkaline phosphatase synthesis response regulator PhoP